MNKKAIVKTACCAAITISCLAINAYAGTDAGIQKAHNIGYQIWGIVKEAGYWICIIFAGKDILKELEDGDLRDIFKTIVKYGVAFFLIASLLKIFDYIGDMAK